MGHQPASDQIFELTTFDMELLLSEPTSTQAAHDSLLDVAQYPSPLWCDFSELPLLLSPMSVPDLQSLQLPIIPPAGIHGACKTDEISELCMPPVLPPPPPPVAPPPHHGAHISGRPMRKGTPSYRQAHIISERQRRQDMASLFATLRSLLPMPVHFKLDRCRIVSYMINYIQHLHKKQQQLAKMKAHLELTVANSRKEKLQAERPSYIDVNGHGSSSNNGDGGQKQCMGHTLTFLLKVKVQMFGRGDIFINLTCPQKRGLWPSLLSFLQHNLQLDVQNITLSNTTDSCFHSIYAKVPHAHHEVSCDKIRALLLDFVSTHIAS